MYQIWDLLRHLFIIMQMKLAMCFCFKKLPVPKRNISNCVYRLG